jgi:tRNA(Ile)-lysidine synthase
MPFNDLESVLREQCGLALEKPVLVGFSGGPDSSALLHALQAQGYRVLVAHLDHGLRPESAEDARHAKRVADSYGVPFFTQRADVAALAKAGRLSIEEAAREERYRFLFRLAAEQGAQAVAVAHTADDQAETILMHLLRGAGPAGLRGMPPRMLPNPWSENIPLVRPLLGFGRNEVVDYCTANQLDVLHDVSNADTTFFRNRLRHDLLPLLETYAPGFRTRLQHSAELISADYALIETLSADAWRRCLSRRGANYLAFDRSTLLAEPLALQRGILRRALGELRPQQRDLDFESVERALKLIRVDPGAPQDWTAGLCVLNEGGVFWIADWQAELPVDWPQAPARAVHIEAPTRLELNSGWRLSLDEVDATGLQPRAEQNQDNYQAWLDFDASGDELLLRRPRRGNRFQPLGLSRGSIKLSDFFINEKLPRRARAAWPLLCNGEQIIWVPGYRLAQPVRLQAGSRRALHVQLARAG